MKKSTTSAPVRAEGFNGRLLAYSTTAGAALLLAPATHAQTAITSFIEQGVNGGNPAATPAPFSVGTNGIFSARHFSVSTAGHHAFNGLIQVDNVGGNGILSLILPFTGSEKIAGDPLSATSLATAAVRRLGNGVNIAATALNPHGGTLAARESALSAGKGHFFPANHVGHTSGYIGFKTAGNKYGWLKLKVTNDGNDAPLTLEFVPASDGLYGQIGDNTLTTPVSAIPEPASVASGLSFLALGAAGVREMRRRWRPVVA